MQLLGLIIMMIGSAGIVSSVVLEIKTGEKIYGLLMKIMPLIFAIGAGLFWAG